jgi:hypothetical protein
MEQANDETEANAFQNHYHVQCIQRISTGEDTHFVMHDQFNESIQYFSELNPESETLSHLTSTPPSPDEDPFTSPESLWDNMFEDQRRALFTDNHILQWESQLPYCELSQEARPYIDAHFSKIGVPADYSPATFLTLKEGDEIIIRDPSPTSPLLIGKVTKRFTDVDSDGQIIHRISTSTGIVAFSNPIDYLSPSGKRLYKKTSSSPVNNQSQSKSRTAHTLL